MFNTPTRPPERPLDPGRGHEANTVIARGVKVEGDLASVGNIVIDGEVIGTLQCSGLLTVGPEAVVKANITAQEVLVAGMVEGNIKAAKRIELKSTAKIIGDLESEGIAIEVGSAISGRLTVGMKSIQPQNKNLPQGKRDLKTNQLED